MTIFDEDIVRDILARAVHAAARKGGFDDVLAVEIERQVKKDWGGERPYIRNDLSNCLAERNLKILAQWNEGCRDIPKLAETFGLSVKQIRRILFGCNDRA
ncbi:Mor transcription activator family protein [Propionivibrio sp.]|uniref:Mor transcription activator family protein n=1 Tax=Propionivibrio sp. TaxID=2212460 RepID=UPI00272EA6DE|nr:Mor transcription activator family protein [Propionivibrio sp.]